MRYKDLKINFRYLSGNIACLSIDSISGESVHNDINNEEAIIIFNSLVGEKEDCQTVKTLLQENQELKKHLEVPETYDLKTLEDYKSYYEDTTKEKILEDTYIDYCAYVNLAHRYSELKKQLEEKQNPLRGIFAQVSDDTLLRDCGNMNAEIKELKEQLEASRRVAKHHLNRELDLENQQKEFIEYMEDKINKIKEEIRAFDIWHEAGVDINFLILKKQLFMEDLSKYKEIIGSDNNA